MADKIRRLHQQFPDISQSMLGDVLNSYNQDESATSDALKGISKQLEQEQEAKVKELHDMFPRLRKKTIRNALKDNKWDIDTAILPLFNELEKIKESERRKQEEEARAKRQKDDEEKRKKEAQRQALELMNAFKSIPKETIQTILDKNEGDIDSTTEELLSVVAKMEEEKDRKNQELEREKKEKDRNIMVTALISKFPDDEEDVVPTLIACNWNVKEAATKLYVISSEKKKKELGQLFQSFTEDQVEEVLERAQWKKTAAVEILVKQREEKRQKRQAEEEQREREKQKEKQEKEKEKEKEKEREQREKEKEKQRQEKEKSNVVSEPPAPIIKKVNLLERSALFGKEMEKEITASQIQFAKTEEVAKKVQRETAAAMFKNELENIIAVQAREGVSPGMAPPPLPKQIDALLGKPKPVEDSVHEEKESSQKEASLLVTPSVVDVGNNVTVQWRRNSSKSLAYDWIALFQTDQPNKSYVTYQWAGKDLTEGTLSFSAPKNFGEYEFRYLTDNGYTSIASSNKFLVQPQFTLNAHTDGKKIVAKWSQASGNPYPRAWIGLYDKKCDNKQFVAWDYASKPDNIVAFDSPVKPGEYELRLFPFSYIEVVRSNTIRIDGNDFMDVAVTDNGVIHVKYDLCTVDPHLEGVWMGVFFTTEKDNRQWRRYKYVKERKSEVVFASGPRTAGEYEVRLFANKNYEPVMVSKPFRIVVK